MCLFLKNQGNGGEDKLSKTFIAALAKPLRNIYNTKGNKFPKTCPVEPVSSEHDDYITSTFNSTFAARNISNVPC